jgi:preprotein translocase subunit SecF
MEQSQSGENHHVEHQHNEHNHAEHHHNKNWYDKSYKWFLIISAVFLLISLVYLYNFNATNGDVIYKDVSLTGGTTISVFDKNVDINKLGDTLKIKFPDLLIRGISNIRTGGQEGFIFETKADADVTQKALEDYLGYSLTKDNSSVEFTGATLSQGFYQQLISAIIAAFLLMSWVVFLIFSHDKKIKAATTMLAFLGVSIVLSEVSTIRTISVFAMFVSLIYGLIVCRNSNKGKRNKDYLVLLGVFIVSLLIYYLYPNIVLVWLIWIVLIGIFIYYSIPSFAVILSAFADIVMTLAVVDMMGMQLSIAGVIAFLMLIGYSVDTDILLTSRLLKDKEGNVNQRLFGAFKTGITMTLTAIAAVGVSLAIIYGFSPTLKQIFTIILIGLLFDIMNTWITNASMLKWYMEVKKIE